MKRFPGGLVAALIGLALVAAIAYGAWIWLRATADQPRFKFAKVERGPLTAAVSATGTLNPVVSVQVGSQVSGQIKEILVDFNSEVKADQVIARLDPESFQLRVRQAEADLEATRAAVAVQRAEVARARANMVDAQRDYDRKKLLVEKNFISPAERDKAQTTYDAAKAAAEVSAAQVRNSEALVRQREAQLASAKVDLERTVIRSPVDGVVVKRSIEPGQTVAASLQAPELFVIARNLTDMQVETSIDEADVGRLRVGQQASFTVDAFPGRGFQGEVRQVRKAALVVSNVVSYTVVISAANPDLTLLPGMTANVRIVTAQKDSVLKVPNASLRYRPPGTGDDKGDKAGAGAPAGMAGGSQFRDRLVAELKLDAGQQAKLDAILGDMRAKRAAARDLPEAERARAQERNRAELRERVSAVLNEDQKKRYDEIAAESQSARGAGGSGRVWVLGADGSPRAVPVRLGLSDGAITEVLGGDLAEGAEIIVGTASAATAKGQPARGGPRLF